MLLSCNYVFSAAHFRVKMVAWGEGTNKGDMRAVYKMRTMQ